MPRALRLAPAVAAAVLASCGSGGGGQGATPDTTPPSISIVGPPAGETIATAAALLRALVTDAGGVASVEYSVDGGPLAPLPAASGGFEVNVPLPLADGVSMTVEVVARDRAGNLAQATRTFRVDRVAPAVAIAGPDATCPDACTGTVVREADGPLHVTGTATDGSGIDAVQVIVTDDRGSDVASAAVPVGAGGSFAWDWDGWSDGHFFTVKVLADDPKGNGTTASRVVYVDRVAPTVSSFPPYTGAPRTGPLVVFSEPMAEASVEAVTTLSVPGGAPVAEALAWADARSFGFTPELAPFTGYHVEIGAGATDRAGNPLAPVGFGFETEMIPPPVDPTVVATGARSPRIGVLPDGRPVAVYGTAGQPRAVRWDGRGAWADAELASTALHGGVAADLDTTSSYVAALLAVPGVGGNDLYYAREGVPEWMGWSGGAVDLVAAGALSAWSPALGVQCLLGLPCQVTVLFGDAAGAKYARRDAAGWSAPNLVKATAAGAGARGAGNAFVDDGVYYLDTWLGPPGTSPPFFLPVTGPLAGVGFAVGAEAWRWRDPTYQAWPMVLYTTARAGPPAADDLHLACLSAAPWRQAVTQLPTTADSLALVVTSATAALAVALADGTVLFATAPNGYDACQAGPAAPAWDPGGAVTDAREPAVGFAPDGATVWRAWIRASTGELVISR